MRPWTKLFLKSPLHPFTSYFFTYLLAGWYDGSHFNPFSELWGFPRAPPAPTPPPLDKRWGVLGSLWAKTGPKHVLLLS